MKKSLIFFLITIMLLPPLPRTVHSASPDALWDNTSVSAGGFDSNYYLSDKNHNSYAKSASEASVTLENSSKIAHIYIIFDRIYGEWTLTDNATKRSVTVGKDGFLHEYISITDIFGTECESLTLSFESNVAISEVYGFTEGKLPDWVQIWEKPLEKADILLLSSHSDDEQLFFAGVLPYYAGERKADVQVVYLINHFDTHNRPHEQLDGLWTVGVKNYPIISDFPDLYSESLDGAISAFENAGISYQAIEEFIVENIRRFKPQVLVTHDIEGEYGHGTHILCTNIVMNVLPSTADRTFYPKSAVMYGEWDVPKTYLHLYDENTITMNWDIPLDAFGGKTAFEMTLKGFECHKSQHWTWFSDWIRGSEADPVTKASDISAYSPCKYGLYRSTVGADVFGGDFLENITLYKDMPIPEPEQTTVETTLKSDDSTTETANAQNSDDSTTKSTPNPFVFICILVCVSLLTIVVYFAVETRYKSKKRKM